jgi:queuine tRNA-ribosyltransferase
MIRTTTLSNRRGDIATPFFMPVATKGSIRGILPHTMKEVLQSQILLMNTYHLYLKPGYENIYQWGGLHSFSQWSGPILTDSGGYQVFSLAHQRKISEEGVVFRSHIDGSRHMLSPEESIRAQYYFGSDIIMVLDECPPGQSSYDYMVKSLQRTTRWAKRCKEELEHLCQQDNLNPEERPLLFGIIQGGTYPDLRRQSLAEITDIGFDGYAIGGVSVGEARAQVLEVIRDIAPLLPEDKPRYLMGLGKPEEIVFGIAHGIDMFDCVIPTREARHGTFYTWNSPDKLNVVHDMMKYMYNTGTMPPESFLTHRKIQNAQYTHDLGPLDPYASWPYAQQYSRAYIKHLFQMKEQAALSYLSMSNLAFYLELMRLLRNMSLE